MKVLVIRALAPVRLVVASARRFATRSPVAARMAACEFRVMEDGHGQVRNLQARTQG